MTLRAKKWRKRRPMSRYGLRSCSCGSSMLNPTETDHVARAAVRGFHQPRPAAGYHGESRAAYARPDLSYKRVVGVILGRARRAEHRDRRPEPRERVEAARELRRDVVHAFGVGRTHRLGLVAEPGEELLVEGQRASARGARLAATRVWSRSASASMRSSRV